MGLSVLMVLVNLLFLKILAGDIEPTTGHISLGPDERLSVLRQNHFDYEDERVIDVVIMGNERLYDIMKEKDAIYMKEDFSDEDGVRAAELEGLFAELGGWEAESEASQLLQNLNISEDLHYQNMSELANGDKVKVLLAKALFGKPDVLLLDEPTNGLDIQSISWLEDFLIDFENTVIVVSHDRHFLNKVCTHMADLDFGKIKLYVGNYDFWKQSSELAARLQADRNAKAEEKIKELQEFVARFSANASKSKQATSRKKMLDKIELEEIVPSSRKYPFIKFKAEREIGNDLLTVENLTVKMDGETILDNISFILRPGDKTAIIGQNDIQTTALIRALADDIDYEGTIKWGLQLAVLTFQKTILKTLHLVNQSLNGFVSSLKKGKTMIPSCVDSLVVCSSQEMKLISLLVSSRGEKKSVSCFLNSCF